MTALIEISLFLAAIFVGALIAGLVPGSLVPPSLRLPLAEQASHLDLSVSHSDRNHRIIAQRALPCWLRHLPPSGEPLWRSRTVRECAVALACRGPALGRNGRSVGLSWDGRSIATGTSSTRC